MREEMGERRMGGGGVRKWIEEDGRRRGEKMAL